MASVDVILHSLPRGCRSGLNFRGSQLFVISAVIGVLSIPRIQEWRANSLAVSSREFVTAARAIGTKPSRILFRR